MSAGEPSDRLKRLLIGASGRLTSNAEFRAAPIACERVEPIIVPACLTETVLQVESAFPRVRR